MISCDLRCLLRKIPPTVASIYFIIVKFVKTFSRYSLEPRFLSETACLHCNLINSVIRKRKDRLQSWTEGTPARRKICIIYEISRIDQAFLHCCLYKYNSHFPRSNWWINIIKLAADKSTLSKSIKNKTCNKQDVSLVWNEGINVMTMLLEMRGCRLKLCPMATADFWLPRLMPPLLSKSLFFFYFSLDVRFQGINES